MGKVLQTYEFDFKFNDKNASKQVRAIAEDVKALIANLGEASDSMTIFKELVSYISGVDKALASFRSANKDGFNSIFGNIDANLTKEIESIFGVLKGNVNTFSNLQQRITLAKDGKAYLATLRGIAEEINNLYQAMGERKPIDIDTMFTRKGSAKNGTSFEQRINILNNALSGFANNFQHVQEKLREGFQIGGSGGDGGASSFSSEIQAEIDQIQRTIEQYKSLMNDVKALTVVSQDLENADIPNQFGSAEAAEDVAKLLSRYKELKDVMASMEDKSSIEYYKTLIEYAKVATKLYTISYDDNNKKLSQSIKAYNFTDRDLISSLGLSPGNLSLGGGKYDLSFTLQNLREQIENFFLSVDFEGISEIFDQEIKTFLTKIDKIKTSASASSVTSGATSASAKTSDNKQLSASYVELKNRLQEYVDLQKKVDSDGSSSGLDKKISQIEQFVHVMDKLGENEKRIDTILEDLSFGDIDINQALSQLSDILKIGIPSATNNINSGNMTTQITDSMLAVQKAKEQMANAMHLAGEIQGKGYFDLTDVDVGQYTERISMAKKELDELGAQGLITAEELASVQESLNSAMQHLSESTKHYTGYGDYHESYLNEYHEAKSENLMLRKANEMLSQAANSGSKQQLMTRFDEIYSSMTRDGLMHLDDARSFEGELDLIQSQIEAMHQLGQVTDEEMSKIHNGRKVLQSYIDDVAGASNTANELNSLASKAMLTTEPEQLSQIVAERQRLLSVAEEANWLGEADLQTERAITEEIQKRIGMQQQENNITNTSAASDVQNQSLKERINLLREISAAYVEQFEAKEAYRAADTPVQEDNAEMELEKARASVKRFTDEYHSAIVAMQDGSRINIPLDEEFEAATESILRNASRIQNIDLVPRSAEAAIQAYEHINSRFYMEEDFDMTDSLEYVRGVKADLEAQLSSISQSDPLGKWDFTNATQSAQNTLSVINDLIPKIELMSQLEERMNASNLTFDSKSFLAVQESVQNGTLVTLDQCIAKYKELIGVANESAAIDANVDETGEYTAETQAIEQRNKALAEGNNLKAQDAGIDAGGAGASQGNVAAEIQQLERLKTILLEVEKAVQAKTSAFREEGVVVGQVVGQEIAALRELLLALGYIKLAIDSINNSFAGKGVNQNLLADTSSVNSNTSVQNAANSGYALDTTLQRTNTILQAISDNLNSNQSLSELIEPLKSMVSELRSVASGIIDHQKTQRTDLTDSSMRIANNYGELSSITSNAVAGLGDNVQIEGMKALANNIVRVRGAVQDASGVYKGFVIDINESNNAVVHAVDKQSKFAESLNATAQAAKKSAKATADFNLAQEMSNGMQVRIDRANALSKAGIPVSRLNLIIDGDDAFNDILAGASRREAIDKHVWPDIMNKLDAAGITSIKDFNDLLAQIENNAVWKYSTRDMAWMHFGTQKSRTSSEPIDKKAYASFSDVGKLTSDWFNSFLTELLSNGYKGNIKIPQDITGFFDGDQIVGHAADDESFKILIDTLNQFISKGDLRNLQTGVDIRKSVNAGSSKGASFSALLEDIYKVAPGEMFSVDEIKSIIKMAVSDTSGKIGEQLFTPIVEDVVKNRTRDVQNITSYTNQDQFTNSLSIQQEIFKDYKKDLQDVDYLSDELNNDLNALATRLQNISSMDGLSKWTTDFEDFRGEVSKAQTIFGKLEADKIQGIRGQLNSEFKNLDFLPTTSNPTAEQREILDLREQLLAQLERYRLGIADGKAVELDSLNATMNALRQKINVYREANNLESGSRQKFGATAILNATAKYNSLKQQATTGEFVNSPVVQAALQQYTVSYDRLIAKRKELATIEGSLTDKQKSEFKQLQSECNNYATALDKIISSSQKLQSNSVAHGLLGEDFDNSIGARKAALTEFVSETYGASATVGEFRDNFNQLTFVVRNGDGTFTEMTATINSARTAIDATAGSTQKAIGAFAAFANELKGKFRSISTYLISYSSIYRLWSVIREGIQDVRDIDLAMTELKKVTSETEETYQKFLDTAANTAAKIGSTVSDFTNATADFARLGYSIEQATELAQAASVYKNVGDGIDDISTASESIISTMKAYGIEAENAMGIVDRFNEIGNNFAISSTGIGEAMQRSASALYEAGNTIDESIALVTGANSVIQNPEQVGESIAQQYSNILLENSYIG